MLIYIGTILCGYLIAFISSKRHILIKNIFILFLFFFLCFGYTTGTDWRNYEMVYEKLDLTNLWSSIVFEPGYMLYIAWFKSLGIDFWIMWCITKCIILYVFVQFINKYNFHESISIITFFVGVFGYYLFIDNPMRILIAMMFFTLSVNKFFNNKKKTAYHYMILAFSFHISAIVLPIYLFFLKKKHSIPCWLIIFVLFNFVFSSKEFLLQLSSSIFGNIPYIQAKIYSYFFLRESDNKIISFGFLINILFFCMCLYKYKQIDDKYKLFCINSTMLFVCLYRLTFSLDIMARFQYYIYLFYAIGLFQLYKLLQIKWRLFLGSIFLIMPIYFTISKVTKDSRYIPYTNYIIYSLFGNDMSYNERLNYNELHSPYYGKLE